jgi:hypothetical protein
VQDTQLRVFWAGAGHDEAVDMTLPDEADARIGSAIAGGLDDEPHASRAQLGQHTIHHKPHERVGAHSVRGVVRDKSDDPGALPTEGARGGVRVVAKVTGGVEDPLAGGLADGDARIAVVEDVRHRRPRDRGKAGDIVAGRTSRRHQRPTVTRVIRPV